jgi:hypothetical protein
VLRDCLYLAMHGVPFDLAAGLSSTQRVAWVVAMGELRGGRFDWEALAWRN